MIVDIGTASVNVSGGSGDLEGETEEERKEAAESEDTVREELTRELEERDFLCLDRLRALGLRSNSADNSRK